MTVGQVVVIVLRIVLPLLILRRPLVGGIIAMAIDALDVVIVEAFGSGGMGAHYHSIDKVLDLYYLGLEAWVSLGWVEMVPKILSLVLFGLRVVGVVAFELTDWRPLLFIFPNLFENWFLFVLIATRFVPKIRLRTWRQCLPWLLALYLPKLGQEYLLHIAEVQPWDWIKDALGLS
jgi:hypothetical protein